MKMALEDKSDKESVYRNPEITNEERKKRKVDRYVNKYYSDYIFIIGQKRGEAFAKMLFGSGAGVY